MRKEKLNNYHYFSTTPLEKLFATFHSSSQGLRNDQIEQAREKYGSNQLAYHKKNSWLIEIVKAYITPFTVVLMLLGVLSFISDYQLAAPKDRDLSSVIIIAIMVIVSGTMSLIQSVKSTKAVDRLQSMVKITATVCRDQQFSELPVGELVVGDLVKLSAGDLIPADLRLLQAKDLFVSQSALTGESYPVEKQAAANSASEQDPAMYSNLLLMGSNVVSGTATAMVIKTGSATFFGDIAQELTRKPAKTNFETGIQKTSWLLIRFMAIMAPLVIIINGLAKGNWGESFLFGLSIAVGLTPEMLPMIVTTNLVKGAAAMAKKGTIVKNINSIQNFGAIDVLCSDKTGTLTEDKIVLKNSYNCEGEADQRVLKHAYLNSRYQTGLKNLLDEAVILAAQSQKLTPSFESYQKVDELPFDFERRRMSVVVKDQTGKTQMITKGAIEELLAVSAFADLHGQIMPLTADVKANILEKVKQLNQQGMRVVGVAQKTNPQAASVLSIKDECELVLIGYLAFLDPPKKTARQALSSLKRRGVSLKLLTGDNQSVTKSVCQQLGLTEQRIISGPAVAAANEAELPKLVENYDVFVKLTPQQKSQIIRTLRKNNHTVGFMGDGINDTPAMKAADVGISVDTAVDIAKESADVILLDKDLKVLEQGILLGRKTFGNIMKYIKITASSNFGNMLSMLLASIFLPFLPMLPLQILLLNLIYDLSCVSVPWDRMDSEYLIKPKKWTTNTISKFMLWFGPTSSIFDITTFLAMYFIICPAITGGSFQSLAPDQQAIFMLLFHTAWFVESLWTQTLVLHALRTPKVPFIQSTAAPALTVVTSLGIAVGTFLPMSPLGDKLQLTSLPPAFWLLLGLTLFAYLLLVTVVKHFYLNKYRELL
ncbi:MAG: magnesium-translocating P-type ATPase [Liquorilactobacillus ghanensis]|uniref:magnesium-translocating P-type ATPase n=1 Tax=Liquorilactobacillus ghanensis TaxID=399370 RepID=UPI0039EC8FEA